MSECQPQTAILRDRRGKVLERIVVRGRKRASGEVEYTVLVLHDGRVFEYVGAEDGTAVYVERSA